MAKWLDWLISGVCLALVLIAEFRGICLGLFEPLPLAAGIALLLLVRVVHQHAPRYIAAKFAGRK